LVAERVSKMANAQRAIVLAVVSLFLSLAFSVPTPASADHAFCLDQRTTIDGTDGNDIIDGTPGDDVIFGGGGDDTINGLAGDEFTLSLWAKTKDLVVGGGSYYYSIEIFHTDNISSDTSGAGLNAGTTGWSKHQNGLVASESYDEIQVIIFFNPDSGKAWFDKVKLVGP